ncbi:MAG: hypothetical protein KGL39_00475 [Patescibacteria group bacterium]|nr:hypothetical protein [Patescibacteria group bacterium]
MNLTEYREQKSHEENLYDARTGRPLEPTDNPADYTVLDTRGPNGGIVVRGPSGHIDEYGPEDGRMLREIG